MDKPAWVLVLAGVWAQWPEALEAVLEDCQVGCQEVDMRAMAQLVNLLNMQEWVLGE